MKFLANVPFKRTVSTLSTFKSLADFRPLQNISSKLVLFSSCHNIFKNLALEDLIYTKSKIENNGAVLLIWIDDPCAVIGRHQNPWTELYVDKCIGNGMTISRRNSGGGTVFHDHGNLNLSFITNRQEYNRKLNLSFVISILRSNHHIECEISSREDIVTKANQRKVSGTASKLSSKNAYHHCTLLVDSDLQLMKSVIRREHPEYVISNATSSTRSSVTNLKELNNSIDIDSVIKDISNAFSHNCFSIDADNFLDTKDAEKIFSSWDWIYGRTPKFTLKKVFHDGELNVNVVKGHIDSVSTTRNGATKDVQVEKVKYHDKWIDQFIESYAK